MPRSWDLSGLSTISLWANLAEYTGIEKGGKGTVKKEAWKEGSSMHGLAGDVLRFPIRPKTATERLARHYRRFRH